MNTRLEKTAYITSLITGLFLLFIGYRFFTQPLAAEAGFGIQTGITNHLEFHYIKGIRDFAVGVLLLVLLFTKEFRSLGWLMLVMGIVPCMDFSLVLSNPTHPGWAIYPHLSAILICWTVGPYYLYATRKVSSFA
ncbi:protein of unknown function [Chitinophaga jiangningensis]|uniref:DUF4267 domain-containing protein n=1 Tax=Chitinophaga jiangningensis TaxID=1419482 RepID=A0A1M7MBA2_9BACT|nr:DUF4267 domain-containing protein [Chitinophaga jiangningensis]SHM87594.1 protein of unknown function [Chitinophaga jiangningensis]